MNKVWSKEELTIILADLKTILSWYESDNRAIRGFEDGTYIGLCVASLRCSIETEEYIKINLPNPAYVYNVFNQYVKKDHSSVRKLRWIWSENSKTGRINWLKKHIRLVKSYLDNE